MIARKKNIESFLALKVVLDDPAFVKIAKD
jgi:hypothetical protein